MSESAEEPTFKEKLNSLQFAPSATPTRSENRKHKMRPMQDPSWEKGVAGETRPDGSFMPWLNKGGSPMGVKEGAERRTELDAIKRQRHQQP